jgi:tetratricopeptide (TPR) repeat protein
LEKLGKPDEALEKLQILAQIAPKDDKVFRELGMILLNQKGDRQGASRMFARSLALNPNQPELTMLARQQNAKVGASDNPMEGLAPPGVQLPDLGPKLPEIPGMGNAPHMGGQPGVGAQIPQPQIPQLPQTGGLVPPSLN